MRIRSLLLRALAVIAVVVAVSVAVALWVYRDIPAAELEARYAGPASRFIIIDGVRMHYRDEGSGPVLVLLHANFSNLIDWDPWVDVLGLERITIGGTSMGGTVAIHYTAAHPERVDRWYDMWMREGQREAQLDRLSQYQAGDIEGLIRSIRVPVLLLWGEANTTAVFSQSVEFRELLADAPSLTFVSYPGVGHMAVEEAGAETGRDVRAWLDAAQPDG
jgi:pimeloyl-ACP methyl ester carboxylesterase